MGGASPQVEGRKVGNSRQGTTEWSESDDLGSSPKGRVLRDGWLDPGDRGSPFGGHSITTGP